jgi:hypothetical protein
MANTKNFANLKNDVADWLIPSGGATNLAARVVDFVLMAEELHLWGDPDHLPPLPGVRCQDMLKRARAPGVDTQFIALPTDYLEMRYMRVVSATNSGKLVQVPHESLDRTPGQTQIKQYAIGRELEFNGTVSSSVTLEMLYYAPFTALDQDTDTNWLLNNCYSAYLYGSLIHAAPYLKDDERVPLWVDFYNNAVTRLQASDKRARANKGEQRVSMGQFAGP